MALILTVVGVVVATAAPAGGDDGRRKPKRRRRSKQERGLPDEQSLIELAATWLECQNRLWPELVAAGLVPKNIPENAIALAAAFRRRFLGEEIVRFTLPSGVTVELAASYVRYSDSNSNPRSNAQQLRLQLEKAHQHKRYIPWECVTGDAAVSGTHTERWGYQLIKKAIVDPSINATTLYIDEIGRASRDALEALSLGKLLQEENKLLIGVSDGFDSSGPFSKMMLHVYAMMQEWFIDQLRSKVNRGMDDAFDLGANIGKPPTGYMLVPMTKDGQKVYGRDGAELKMLAINPQTRRYVERAFVLYTVKKKSAQYIARYFNRLRVDGRINWDRCQIARLLRRSIYRGVKTYRMTKHVMVKDKKTNQLVRKTKKFDKSEWRFKEMPELCIIQDEKLWNDTQARLDEAAAAWKKSRDGSVGKRRDEVYPRRLVTPECGICGHVMYQSGSGKWANFYCPNGVGQKDSCTFRDRKSIKQVEKSVLQPVLTDVLVATTEDKFVAAANEHLEELAKLPQEDVSPLVRELDEVKAGLKNLYDLVEKGGCFSGADGRISALERRKTELVQEIASVRSRSGPVPPPLTRETIAIYFDKIRELLHGDVARAALILRQLTGPVSVFPTGRKVGNRHIWEARFTVNMLPVLVEIGRDYGLTNSDTLEFLSKRGWKFEIAIVAEVDKPPRYEQLANEFRQMAANGLSVSAMAFRTCMTWRDANDCKNFALTGKPPRKYKQKKKRPGPAVPRDTEIAKRLAPEVLKRRPINGEGDTFAQIAKDLGITEYMATRAHDEALRMAGIDPLGPDGTFDRGKGRKVPVEKIMAVHRHLKEGKLTVKQIADETGVSASTIRREMKKHRAA